MNRFLGLLVVLSLLIAGCKKSPANMTFEEKLATLPPPLQPLFRAPWKVDVNASALATSKAAEAKTGIKGDVQFGGDVGKAAQFMAKTLTFGFEKGTLTRVYGEKFGEGILSTETTGWVTVDDAAKNLTLKDANDKETSYTIAELKDGEKLVLIPKSGGAYQVLIPKGATPMAGPTGNSNTAATPATPRPEPDAKYKKTSYAVGDRVVAKWGSGSYYLSTIKGKSGAVYDVTYEDSTTGKVAVGDMVPVVKAKDVKVGDRVAGCWRSCRTSLYVGTVDKKTPTGATIKWSDGSSPSDVKDGEFALF